MTKFESTPNQRPGRVRPQVSAADWAQAYSRQLARTIAETPNSEGRVAGEPPVPCRSGAPPSAALQSSSSTIARRRTFRRQQALRLG